MTMWSRDSEEGGKKAIHSGSLWRRNGGRRWRERERSDLRKEEMRNGIRRGRGHDGERRRRHGGGNLK